MRASSSPGSSTWSSGAYSRFTAMTSGRSEARSPSSSRASRTRAPSGSSIVICRAPARSRSIAKRRTVTCTPWMLRGRHDPERDLALRGAVAGGVGGPDERDVEARLERALPEAPRVLARVPGEPHRAGRECPLAGPPQGDADARGPRQREAQLRAGRAAEVALREGDAREAQRWVGGGGRARVARRGLRLRARVRARLRLRARRRRLRVR